MVGLFAGALMRLARMSLWRRTIQIVWVRFDLRESVLRAGLCGIALNGRLYVLALDLGRESYV